MIDRLSIPSDTRRKQFLVDVDKLVELPEGTLQGPEKLKDLENWNSMAIIGYIALVDTATRLKLSLSQIISCSTVADLLKLAGIDI